jgi:hypothetical protein
MGRNWNTSELADVYKRRGVPCPIQDACGDGRKQHKYHAQPVTIDGHRFDSTLEARHFQALKIAAEKGWISDLELQPQFVLQEKLRLPSGKIQRAIVFKGDFRFKRDGLDICVDSKGFETPMFKIKRKLFRVKYPDVHLQVWGKE